MDNHDKNAIKWGIAILAFVFASTAVVWVTGAYFESRTYNRVTGAHTTTWDAMWIELRVMDSPKTNNP